MRPALVALIACTLPLHALAQEGPMGIAFVQAPEQSWGVAMGATPGDAFRTATEMCVTGGAEARDCLQTNWCFPAGWSIDIFAQHQEGLHWHEVQCGLPERALAEAVAAQLCDRAARPWLIECALVQVYDPQGTPMMPYE